MKRLALLVVLLLSSLAYAQDAKQFADFTLVLVPSSGDGISPMLTADQKLIYVPVPAVREAATKGAVSIRFGQVLDLLGTLSAENQRLQAENQRLWKLVENTTQHENQPTVVVQQPAAPPIDAEYQRKLAIRQMLIQNMLNANRPPQQMNMHVTVSDCTKLPALCVGAH